ncbi:MAG TPA: glycosyltransferase family 4 protein, partial [Candidatus Cloacimonadota bacterium]|nr:glycosyltransferase family 4 protein [Candidatus Cloacimonadota bacterium]
MAEILFIQPTRSTFIEVDKAILSSVWKVDSLILEQDKSKWIYLKNIMKAFYSMLRAPGLKLIVVWFADYHAAPAVLAAILRNRRSVIFIGGYDAVHYPELKMGVYANKIRAACAAFALRHSDLIIANHQALIDSDNLYYRPGGHPEGVKRLVSGLRTPCVAIANSLSVSYQPDLGRPRQAAILTVANTPRLMDFYNKGLDMLTGIARMNPQWKFIFVGLKAEWIPELNRQFNLTALTNLKIISHLPQTELLSLMETVKVYAQPSISEGMPNALMEAMLCGCIPVGSNVAGIPEVIGDLGYILKNRNADELSKLISEAFSDTHNPEDISASVATRFALPVRKQ